MQAKSWLPESDLSIKGNVTDIVDKPLGLPSRRQRSCHSGLPALMCCILSALLLPPIEELSSKRHCANKGHIAWP